jgi:hypothetical protein
VVKFLARLREWLVSTFHHYVRNGVTEREILEWLKARNYSTDAKRLANVQLFAIQRPGWLQVFRFEVEVRDSEGHPEKLFGALRSDERFGDPTICVFETSSERDDQLHVWSQGMIVRR